MTKRSKWLYRLEWTFDEDSIGGVGYSRHYEEFKTSREALDRFETIKSDADKFGFMLEHVEKMPLPL